MDDPTSLQILERIANPSRSAPAAQPHEVLKPDIGLGPSGYGYRAMLFHVGAVVLGAARRRAIDVEAPAPTEFPYPAAGIG
jgi:hypothetical protein